MKITEPLLIDYLDIIETPKMSKEQNERFEKMYEELNEVCKKRKMKVLVVDSSSPFRGLKEV